MTDDALTEVMAERVEGTLFTYGDLALIGHQILNAVVTARMMRHETPAGSVGYAEAPGPGDPVGVHIAHDFIAWVGNRRDVSPDSGERLLRAVEAFGWQSQQLAAAFPTAVT